jgi:Holliday junction resolvase YEN1
MSFHRRQFRANKADGRIWIFHAAIPQHGENPFLRTIFFKITSLLHQPVLPVFVFDGPAKPGYKRNQRVAGGFGTSDSRSRQFKELLDEMGLEWWNVSG